MKWISVLLIMLISINTSVVLAEEDEDQAEQEQVIKPNIFRRDILVPKIDTEDFEITGFYGVLDVEDFGSEPVIGIRAAYHITEDFFVEATYAESEVKDDSFRRLGLPLFPQETQDVEYYALSVGYNILPGEVFLGRDIAMSSSFYVLAGVGNVEFIDEDEFAYHAGVGLKVLPTDWLSVRFDFRDYIYETDLLGENEFTHNLEATLNLGVFF
ncbi:MAG: outer membrane beta-barrel domain-containing protein [Gammaproteobacteria bacterium]|nr:outer membrane beta-barrel domain-containing protein [Gammaproteobacteria bacterium]